MLTRRRSASRGRNNHDHGREPLRLPGDFRIGIAAACRPVFHRDTGRKRHRLIPIPCERAAGEHVRRRILEDQFAAFTGLRPVVRRHLGEAGGGPEDVIPLRASRVVRREELRPGKNRHAERCRCRRIGIERDRWNLTWLHDRRRRWCGRRGRGRFLRLRGAGAREWLRGLRNCASRGHR